MSYIERVEFSSVSPEGFSGNWSYKEKVTFTVSSKDDMDEALERAKTNFALKYGVDRQLVKVYRDTSECF
jgi:hypothetical protein